MNWRLQQIQKNFHVKRDQPPGSWGGGHRLDQEQKILQNYQN